MKTLKLTLLLMFFSLASYAQGSRVYASYDLSKLRISESQFQNDLGAISLNGGSLGYAKSFAINPKQNLFVELGAKASYAFYGVTWGELYTGYSKISKYTMTLMSVSIPINIGYVIELNSKCSLEPYAGISLKANVYASYNEMFTDSSSSSSDFDDTYNLLSDVALDNSWSVGQLSAQVGVGINICRIYLSVSYSADITAAAKDVSYNTLSVGAGFNF